MHLRLDFIFIDVLETMAFKLSMVVGFDFSYWLFEVSYALFEGLAHLLSETFKSAWQLPHV